MAGELRGIASVAIMTEQFVSAAELMARVLGAESYPFAVIDHPISSATPDELATRARTAAAECAILLTSDTRLS